MTELTRERDILKKSIDAFTRLFHTTAQIIADMQRIKDEAVAKEAILKAELTQLKMSAKSLAPEVVEKTTEALAAEKEAVTHAERRVCSIPTAHFYDREVLGKIGHLALVSDERIAVVLSWHMSADMDCVVTITPKKAKHIFKQTEGRQQVLPLNSIYRKIIPDWNKPLPHVEFKPNWSPPGSPVYARDVLHFPKETMYCRIVFKMLLGDTLILDNLNAATSYRKEIIQHTHCPTILTRDGDRIHSNGKFGGVSNKAVPKDRLRGAVFGEPLPHSFGEIDVKLEKLQAYRAAIAGTCKARNNLHEQQQKAKSAETEAKEGELAETKQRLAMVEEKIFGLGEKSNKPKHELKRETPATPRDLSPTNKRPRMSKPPPVTPDIDITPTRQSARIAADPRLRGKRVVP